MYHSVCGISLVVAGFGSTCCHSANALRAAEPDMLVRQFSYLGLNAAGQPIPYHHAAGNLTIQVLGDRMATQVEKLYQQVHTPVDIVAESEGTLGLYAMLARHPHVPIGSVVLLSPIVEPGQVGPAGSAGDTVPGAALDTLNDLVGAGLRRAARRHPAPGDPRSRPPRRRPPRHAAGGRVL